MRAAALPLWAALLAAPGAAFAQASTPPARAGSGTAQAADSGKPAPKLMDAARRHYDDAIQFFKEGRYDAARVEFEASFALSKEADLLYNLSTTAEKQGQLADAIRYAERYLEAKPNAEDAAVVRERIANLRAQQQPPGSVTKPPDPPPPSSPPQNVTPVPDSSAWTTSASLPKPAIGLLAGGAGLLIAGIGTGAAALAAGKELAGTQMAYLRDLQDLQQRGSALNTAGIILSVAGGAAVVAGASWLIVWKTRSRQATQP